MKRDAKELWERQPGESAKAFLIFCIYRDMGADRTLREASQQSGRSKKFLERLSARDNWVSRSLAYDDHLQRIELAAAEKARREMGKRHAQIAMLMEKKALEKLQALAAESMSTGDTIKMMDVAIKAERLARGESTENVSATLAGGLNVAHYPLTVATVEEWAELAAKYKAGR
jgi:uncharacterized protein YoaH (UPF0181 family)